MSLLFQYPLANPATGALSGSNWSFENGLTGWSPDSACWQVGYVSAGTSGLTPYHGDAHATFDSFVTGAASGTMFDTGTFAASVGTSKTATVRIAPQPGIQTVSGRIGLQWLTAADALIQTDWSAYITVPTGGWQLASVTAVAPATTAKVRIALGATNTDTQYKTGRVCFDWCTLV